MMQKSHSHSLYAAVLLLVLCSGFTAGLQAQSDTEHAPEAHLQTLLIYGDSLSAAYRMNESQGWVALLAQRMADKGLPYRVVNASVSGETTVGGLARLPAVLAAQQPDIVMLELGGNDGLRGMPVESIRANLLAMIDLIEAAGAIPLLAEIQIPPNYGPRYTEPFTSQFAQIAADRKLLLIPFLIDGIPQNPDLMLDDGIHPRAEAQGQVLDNVWPFLEGVLQKAAADSKTRKSE